VRIFTGANVPPGADAIAIVEETERLADPMVRFLAPATAGQHIRRRGEDACGGDVLLGRGIRLDAAQISTCAAVGADPVAVFGLPSVAVLCSGDELKAPGEDVRSFEIRNSNGPAVLSALAQAGVRRTVDLGSVQDELGAIRDRIAEGLAQCDAVIVTGGVSKGDYDLVPEAAREAGCTIHVHGVRVKPGKPFLFATGRQGGPVFGLPGNPLSVLVTFWEFAAPCLRAMMGDPEPDVWRIPARLTHEVRARGRRTVLAPAFLRPDPAGGGILASPVGDRSSADLAAAARANGTVRLEPETGVYPAHSVVEAHPWERPW
jgi:molybdopterin molybdotransferase